MRGRDDPLAFLTERTDNRLISKVLCAEQRDIPLQTEIRILLHEAGSVGAKFHGKNRIDIHAGQLPDIGAEVSGIQGIPELTGNFAAALGKYLDETCALLVPEGVILRYGGHPLIALLQCPIGQWAWHLARRIAGDANDIADALPLREVIGSDDRNEIGCAVILDVVGNCQPGIGQKVSKQKVDLFLLNETARLLKRRKIGRASCREGLLIEDGDTESSNVIGFTHYS